MGFVASDDGLIAPRLISALTSTVRDRTLSSESLRLSIRAVLPSSLLKAPKVLVSRILGEGVSIPRYVVVPSMDLTTIAGVGRPWYDFVVRKAEMVSMDTKLSPLMPPTRYPFR
jgi:hypothetical protein